MKRISFILLMLFPLLSSGQWFDPSEEQNIYFDSSFGDYEIFKDNKKNTFFIVDENQKVIEKNLKFCKPLSMDYIQAINKKNELIYFNKSLDVIQYPKPFGIMVCGTVNSYHLKLIKKDNFYFVETTTNRYFTGGDNSSAITAEFENQNFDKIYFINGKQELSFDDNSPLPTYLIFLKNFQYGVIDNNKVSLYDNVSICKTSFGEVLKVKRGELFNYYHLSNEVKYKKLDDYEFHLAYFELENGKRGYLDLEGKEYYFK